MIEPPGPRAGLLGSLTRCQAQPAIWNGTGESASRSLEAGHGLSLWDWKLPWPWAHELCQGFLLRK